MVSSVPARSSRGKGGGSALLSTSTWQSPTSTSPVGRLGLAVPSGRARTVPVTRTTHSLRTSTAPSITHWTRPSRSRRSTKARCSPCSRRRATQPHSATFSPIWGARSSPHQWVRIPNAGAMSWVTCPPSPTACVPGPPGRRGPRRLVAAGHVAHGHRLVGDLLLPHDQRQAGAGAAGRLHLRLHRPAVEGPVDPQPGRAQLVGQVAGDRAVGGVDDEGVERGPTSASPPRPPRPAASARCPNRSRCPAWAGRRAARPGRRSGRRR